MRRRRLAALLLLALPASASRAQRANPVNLWLVDLRWTGDHLTVGVPSKLTHDEGNNSQPSFTPDGRAVLFSATRDTGATARSDIYRIDLATRTETRVTHTPENENSPTMNERGEYVAVRWQPATLFREFGVWVYAPDGTPKHGVLRGPDTTGYYTALPNGDYALTRPKAKTFTLAIFDAKTGAITDIDSGLPALPAQRVPGVRALSYVRVDSSNARHSIRRLDLDTRQVTTLAPTLVGRTVHAWAASHGTMLMAKGNVLYARVAGRDTAWRVVATFDNPELRNASAYAVSPKGDRLVLTSPQRLALAVALRDSLEAGRGGTEVAAMVLAWRDAGRLGEFDVTEGALGALGDERLQRKHTADAVAIHTLATTLFPASHRAFARLGDAQRAAGDSAAAIGSYRKALASNPRATDADRNAAAAVGRKLGPPPAAQSIAGEWDASMNTPGGVRTFSIVFKVSGDTLTGTVRREAGNVPLFGTIKGNVVTFSYTVMYNGNALELTMTATVDGDSMKGTVDMGGVAQDDFWAKRASAAPGSTAGRASRAAAIS